DSPVPTAERHTAWNPERPRVYRQTARGGMIHCGTFAGAAEKVPMEGKQSRLAMTWSLVRLRCDACKRAGCKRLLCGTLHFLLPGGGHPHEEVIRAAAKQEGHRPGDPDELVGACVPHFRRRRSRCHCRYP